MHGSSYKARNADGIALRESIARVMVNVTEYEFLGYSKLGDIKRMKLTTSSTLTFKFVKSYVTMERSTTRQIFQSLYSGVQWRSRQNHTPGIRAMQAPVPTFDRARLINLRRTRSIQEPCMTRTFESMAPGVYFTRFHAADVKTRQTWRLRHTHKPHTLISQLETDQDQRFGHLGKHNRAQISF